MLYHLQFFSRPSDEGDAPAAAEFSYDGSMTTERLSLDVSVEQTVADLDDHAEAMGCIHGECMVVVSMPWPLGPDRMLRSAYRFPHNCRA